MAILEFEKPSAEPMSESRPVERTFTPTAAEIRAVMDTAERARSEADRLGMKFEAYLLHTAILALAGRMDLEA